MLSNPELNEESDIKLIDHALDLLSLVHGPEDATEYHETWLNAGEAFERIKVQLRLLQAARDLQAMEYQPATPVEEVC